MTHKDHNAVTDFNWWLKWLACWITLAGAVSTAAGWDPVNVYLLNAGSAIYLWWSVRIREHSLIVINTGLLIIYFSGTISRLFA